MDILKKLNKSNFECITIDPRNMYKNNIAIHVTTEDECRDLLMILKRVNNIEVSENIRNNAFKEYGDQTCITLGYTDTINKDYKAVYADVTFMHEENYLVYEYKNTYFK